MKWQSEKKKKSNTNPKPSYLLCHSMPTLGRQGANSEQKAGLRPTTALQCLLLLQIGNTSP